MMNYADLDRHITGNWGEDSVGEPDSVTVTVDCPRCGVAVQHSGEWIEERDEDGERYAGWIVMRHDDPPPCDCDWSDTDQDWMHDEALAAMNEGGGR